MTPIQPTPFETAQWIIETHAEDTLGRMSEQEHDAYLAGLELVCDGMNAADLRRALGAVVDIAQEFMFELADSGVEEDRILHLVRYGRGRTHVTDGLPRHPSKVGAVAAFRFAETIVDVDIRRHMIHTCDDEALDGAFEANCERAETAMRARTFDQLFLVGY